MKGNIVRRFTTVIMDATDELANNIICSTFQMMTRRPKCIERGSLIFDNEEHPTRVAFDVVTDEDFVEPDISEYEIQE